MTTSRAFLVVRFIVASTAVAATPTPASAASASDLRLVALIGQPAPGTPLGTRFAIFGPAGFDGAPSIGADSAIGFAAVLSDGTAGFWIDRGSGPELLARSGSPAPGTEPGVVFSQRIAEGVIFTPPFLVPGQAVLRNSLSGPGISFDNDVGIWRSTGSGLALVSREGAPIPDLPGVQLATMRQMAVDDAGRSVLSALLSGAVVAANDESLVRASADAGLELLVREGGNAPGTGVGVVYATSSGPSAFPFVVGNAVGDLLFRGDLQGPGTGAGNDEALFFHGASGTRLFLREGDPVPGLPGFVFRQGSTAGFDPTSLSLADDGHVVVAARVASTSGLASALLSGTVDALAPLVRPGDPAPGTSGRFDLLVSPVMNLHGDVAFLASLASGELRPPLGLWISAAGGLRAIALPDRPVTGQPDAAIFQNIRSINGFNDRGSVLFTADLTGPDGLSSSALLLADLAGRIHVLARTGGTLTISSGDLRTVSQIRVRRKALSERSRAAFSIAFTDGSSAQIVSRPDRVLAVRDPLGHARVERVGPGTAGKGGLVPSLSVGPGAEGSMTLEVSGGTGGARGILVLTMPDDPLHPDRFGTIAVGCGRALTRGNGLALPSVLSGTPGVAGEGRFTLALPPLPARWIGTTFYVQAGYPDLDAPCGAISLTDIVKVNTLSSER